MKALPGLLTLVLFSFCSSPKDLPAREDGYYTCPMHPQIHEDHPGNCPICHMTLVFKPGKFREAKSDIKVDPATERNMEWIEVPVTMVVPGSSILETGKRSIAFVQSKDGKTAREVIVMRYGTDFRILKNLKPGDRIALDAQFLFDSETNLNARIKP